jgi:hypothetical protein
MRLLVVSTILHEILVLIKAVHVPSIASRTRSGGGGVYTELLILGINGKGPVGRAFYQGAEQGQRS